MQYAKLQIIAIHVNHTVDVNKTHEGGCIDGISQIANYLSPVRGHR